MKLCNVLGLGFLSLFLCQCMATRELEFDRFKHPVLISKVRYPGDTKNHRNVELKQFIGETSESETHSDYYHSHSEGNNITQQAKRAIRGVSQPYLGIDSIDFHVFQTIHDKSVGITIKGSTHSIKEAQ